MARMHGIGTGPTPLGPVLTSEVKVDGATTKVLLIDAGSPVSIIFLDFILQAASAGSTTRLVPIMLQNWPIILFFYARKAYLLFHNACRLFFNHLPIIPMFK